MSSAAPLVGVIMGSQSDWATMKASIDTLESLGIPCEPKVISAHRNPERLHDYVTGAKAAGIKVLICGAGMAAALPGVVAAMTPLPVFGVPMETRVMGGIDSLLSIVQMPRGVPVGCLAIGGSGATNAALLAAAVLALSDTKIAAALDAFRKKQDTGGVEDPRKVPAPA
jgi:5-(carboxyamino)imidazole ribonucleotide mutase